MPSVDLPVNHSFSYFVEERLAEDITTVNFAWSFDNYGDAWNEMVKQMNEHGHDRFYALYIHIEY